MDTMPGMLWTKERVEKWLREHGASGDVRLAVVLASDIVYDYEAALSNQYQRIERFVELVDQLERKLQEATEANTSCTIYIASQMERIDELEAQLAQTWQPLPDGDVSSFCYVDNGGKLLGVFAGDDYTDWYATEDLPDNVRVCRRQEADDE